VPSLARNTGGPAVTLVQGTRAMGTAVRRVIYATDAAQPAATRPFRRLDPADLPDGSAEVPLRIFPTRPPYELGFSPGLWAALARNVRHADLVTIHSVNLFPQYAAFTTALRAGVPYVVTPHGSLDPWLAGSHAVAKRLTNTLWQNRMLRRAAAIHFTTTEEAELAPAITAAAPHLIVPNGMDTARFGQPRSGEAFRSRYLDGHPGQIVLFLGRVARKKGIDLLIAGFARAAGQRDALLVIAGPDDEALTGELRRVAAAHQVDERVRFVGPVYGEDQLTALAAADVWALTSHTENFGNAVIEAMAAGRAVLVSTEVNLSAQIARAQAGIVTDLSIDAIAGQLRALLEDPGRRAELGVRARGFAARFDWSIIAPELVTAFTEIVQARRRG
jgi:glycosyltransferase involved in cell wall biosynthesis